MSGLCNPTPPPHTHTHVEKGADDILRITWHVYTYIGQRHKFVRALQTRTHICLQVAPRILSNTMETKVSERTRYHRLLTERGFSNRIAHSEKWRKCSMLCRNLHPTSSCLRCWIVIKARNNNNNTEPFIYQQQPPICRLIW